MDYLILVFVGIGGFWLIKFFRIRRSGRDISGIAVQKVQENEENRRSVLEFLKGKERITSHQLKGKRARITKHEVEKLLDVSDVVAEKYLSELERKGLVSKIGQIGEDIYYERVDGSS